MEAEFWKRLKSNNCEDLEDLLHLADYTREVIGKKEKSDLNKIIKFVIQNDCCEAMSWVLEIIQENIEKSDFLENYSCKLGRQINQYNNFIENMNIKMQPIFNDIKKVNNDEYNEVNSFYNIQTYETRYRNIFLVSSENFDNKDEDFIEYKIVFSKKIRDKIEKLKDKDIDPRVVR